MPGSAPDVVSHAEPTWAPTPVGRLVIISGPSGVGKSTLVDLLAAHWPYEFSVSATTRAPRPGEVDGADYHFVSRPAFEALIADGALLEWAEYNTNLYGTPKAPVLEQLASGANVLLEIEVQGAQQVKLSHPESLAIFVAPPSMEELEARLRGRRDTDEASIMRRMERARLELAVAQDQFDHIVVNHDVDTALGTIIDILSGTESSSTSGMS